MVVGDKDGRYCGSINALDREDDDNLNSRGRSSLTPFVTVQVAESTMRASPGAEVALLQGGRESDIPLERSSFYTFIVDASRVPRSRTRHAQAYHSLVCSNPKSWISVMYCATEETQSTKRLNCNISQGSTRCLGCLRLRRHTARIVKLARCSTLQSRVCLRPVEHSRKPSFSFSKSSIFALRALSSAFWARE